MQSSVVFITLLAASSWFLPGCGNFVASEATPSAAKPEAKTLAASAASSEPAPVDPAPAKDAAPVMPAAPATKAAAPQTAAREEKKSPIENPPPEEPATALQEAAGPEADDSLLGLLQRDIEQAMAQPDGRRKIQFSMTLVENDRVRYFIDFFCGRLKGFFQRALSRSGKYIPMMATVLQEAGLPEDLVYLSLIESGFTTAAVSKAKAVGPWQFIRATGLRYGLRIDNWIDERRDPVKSTRAAVAYLKDLHEQFDEWFLAAAAYNAGERKVEKAIQRSQTNDFWSLSEKTILKQETRNYVPKFIAAALIAADPEKYGFTELVYEAPMDYDEVVTYRPLTLQAIATLARTTVANVKELNPSLLRSITPPGENAFTLRVPSGSGDIFTQAYKNHFDSSRVTVITHTVRKGETLAAIAQRHHLRLSQVMEANELKSTRLRVGQELLIVQEENLKMPPSRQTARRRPPVQSQKSKGK